jgi:predicted porin
MRLRFLVVSFLLAFLLLGGTAFSQTFTGLFDGYYAFSLNKPTAINGSMANTIPFRAFDVNHQTFSLNYAELAVEQKPKPVGYRVDIGFGDAARIVNSTEPSTTDWEHIQQAYVTAAKGNLTLDFGKFVTPLGAEVIETKDNWNYSRGLLFTFAIPFYHFGVRATYAASDKVTAIAYVVNGWNNVTDNNRDKSIGLTAILKPTSKLTLTENYLMGNENTATGIKTNRRHVLDSITTYTVNKRLSAMANYDYGFDQAPLLTGFPPPNFTPVFVATRRRLQGIATYGKISPMGKDTGLIIVPRYELLKDYTGEITGTPQKIQEGTVTFQMVSKDAGTFWAEYRRDFASVNTDFFVTTQGGTRPRFNQDTVEFGYTYSFTKEVK